MAWASSPWAGETWAGSPAAGGSATDLTIQDATHGHTADGVTVTLDTTIATADATHAHTADNLTVTADGSTDLVIADALHGHTADSLNVTTTGDDVSLGAAGKRARRRRFQDYDVQIPPELVKSAVPSDTVVEPIAQPAPVDARASRLAKRSALQTPTTKSKPANKGETPRPVSQSAQDAEPQSAVAAPIAQPASPPAPLEPIVTAPKARPMMLSDILSAETMTTEEMTAAIKLLARIQLGPQLMRSTRKARLIREPG